MDNFITTEEIKELLKGKRISRDFKVNDFVYRLSFGGYYQEFYSDVITFDIKINETSDKKYMTVYAIPVKDSSDSVDYIYNIAKEVFYSINFCDICGKIDICEQKESIFQSFTMNVCPCCEDDIDKKDFQRNNLNLFQYYINRSCSKDFYKVL